MFKSLSLLSYEIFDDKLDSIKIDSKRKIIVNCINSHAHITAKNDLLFAKALKESDIILPDGSGIVLAARVLKNKKIKKLAGQDFHLHILSSLNECKGSVFYMGSSEETLKLIQQNIKKDFPYIRFGKYSPPYKSSFSDEDNELIIKAINLFDPDVLFVGLTAPKQEKWLYQNKEKLNFSIGSSIGAAFNFYAGDIERPSNFWIKLHLEWFKRFLKEPKRLFKRNFISSPLFLIEIFALKINKKK